MSATLVGCFWDIAHVSFWPSSEINQPAMWHCMFLFYSCKRRAKHSSTAELCNSLSPLQTRSLNAQFSGFSPSPWSIDLFLENSPSNEGCRVLSISLLPWQAVQIMSNHDTTKGVAMLALLKPAVHYTRFLRIALGQEACGI